jgi:hypothetical protein
MAQELAGLAAAVRVAGAVIVVIVNAAFWAVGRQLNRHRAGRSLMGFEAVRACGMAAAYLFTYPQFLHDPAVAFFLFVAPTSILAFPILALLASQRRWLSLGTLVLLPALLVAGRTVRDVSDPAFPLSGADSCAVARSGSDLHFRGALVADITTLCESGTFCEIDTSQERIVAVFVALRFVVNHRAHDLQMGVPDMPYVPGAPHLPVPLPSTFVIGQTAEPRIAVGTQDYGGGSGSVSFTSDAAGSINAVLQGAGGDVSGAGQLSIRGTWSCPYGVHRAALRP